MAENNSARARARRSINRGGGVPVRTRIRV